MRPPRPRPSRVPPPRPEPARRQFAIPEGKTLRELRHVLARGGIPSLDKRTPEADARIVAFRTVQELLRFFEQCRRRVEAGESCHLVEREHPYEPGRLLIEFAIEVRP